jgi:hypothetical protein
MAGIHSMFYGPPFTAMVATGGTISDFTDGDGVSWRVHVFNDTGSFNVSVLGSLNGYVQRLVLGGGGGGGWQNFKPEAGACGGGGAGEHRGGENWANTDAYGYAVLGANAAVVGNGGALASDGLSSSFLGLTALGGGAGGKYGVPATTVGRPGGSGGGAGQPGTGLSATGGVSIGNGNRGGNCAIPARKETSGGAGGGGAGGPGFDSYGTISPFNGGNGGPGKISSITGAAVMRAAGGGGAGCNRSSESGTGNGAAGIGGSGIGGNGAAWEFGPAGTAPVQNTGSGGGGSVGSALPGFVGTPGAKGQVIVRYPRSAYKPPHLG